MDSTNKGKGGSRDESMRSSGGVGSEGEENTGEVPSEKFVGKRKDKKRGRGRHSRRRRSIKGGRLIKCNITRYTYTTSNRIIATIAFMLKAIPIKTQEIDWEMSFVRS